VTEIQNRASTLSRIGVLCPLACAVAILLCASACGAASTASGGSASPAPSTGTAVSRSTPATALKQWLDLVVRGDYGAACKDMDPPRGSIPSPPVPVPANLCSSKPSSSPSVIPELIGLHRNFAIDGITPHTSITVATAHVKGTITTVNGTDIHVSRTTLTSLMIAHGTGVKPGQFNISFTLWRASGAWYVTGINLSV
jgi:hypothetical protein